MIQITLNNNKFKLRGNQPVLNKIFEDMKVKHPNQWFIRPYMEPGWDGKIKYLTEAGYAKTGLLPMVTRLIEQYGETYTIIDNRTILEFDDIPLRVGEFKPRDYQIEAAESIIYNEVGDIFFQRGVIGAATNAGKTIIAGMLYKSFKDAKCVILVNNTDLYKQFLDDMPTMFGDDWGYMQGKNVKWANVMVCMTPTLRNNLDRYARKLAEFNMCIFDECHLITSKTNKKVVSKLYNTIIRVGLSGTAFAHKDQLKNMDVRAFFGDEVYTIKNIELMDKGYSTPIVVKMITGNTKVHINKDYPEEYKQGITLSRERTKKSLERSEYYLKRDCYPILVIGKFHQHVEELYSYYQARFGHKYKVAYIHHKIKDRKEILDRFKSGDIDILISSLIIKLGQNIPLIRYMQNAASGDSQINALQLIGRAIRKHKSKKKVYYEDFADMGAYLRRHSKHRYRWYKKEGFKVMIVGDEARKILGVKQPKMSK